VAKLKKKKVFFCDECGYDTANWLGKCPQCEAWNSFKEMTITPEKGTSSRRRVQATKEKRAALTRLDQVSLSEKARISLGSEEFDRVLGGGVYPRTTVLLAGEPGIGKSTLLLQACGAGMRMPEACLLYVSAEESIDQIRIRSDRLGIAGENIYCVAETDLDMLIDSLDELQPTMVVIDSIQAMSDSALDSSPGSITQVREVALRLSQKAKENGFVLFLIGHVTKDGVLAGPRTLEHLVDVVVYFEGDRYENLRVIRTIKNRYGSTGEVGIFEMTQTGLHEVTNPSSIFLPEAGHARPGCATVAIMEGRRPFLVEVQALTSQTAFNNPLRRALGIEANKIPLLIAVIERTLEISLAGYDIFLKAVGGFSIREAGSDLALAAAILSSFRNKPIAQNCVFIGELGLGGEVRKVKNIEARVKEAARLGFDTAYLPKNSRNDKNDWGIQCVPIAHLSDVEGLVFL
jgi:DNA repair protein RadA/Sms